MSLTNATTLPAATSRDAPLRIGIVGANASRGWALSAHLPSIRCFPDDLVISAVSARTQDLAEEARVAFDAQQAFGDSLALVRSADVDIVLVTVRVPEHRDLVMAALDAGKHVLCEWPLGRTAAEADEMAAAVPANSHVMIGLQGLSSPAVRQAQSLIASGALGALRIMRITSPSVAWGAEVPPFYAYLQDRQNGATLETIPGGHTLALIEALAGRYCEVDARNSILRKQVRVSGTDDMVERTCADHMMVLGQHDSGCVSTLEIAGGSSTTPFSLTLEGENGWIRLFGANRVGVPVDYQAGPVFLETSWAGVTPLNATVPGLKGASVNVSESYARFLADVRSGTRSVPDFDTARRLARLIDSIALASANGRHMIA